MSMILCTDCGGFCDSDEYPEGFYRLMDDGNEVLSDDFKCEGCNEHFGG